MFISKKDDRKIYDTIKELKSKKWMIPQILCINIMDAEKKILDLLNSFYLLPTVLNNIIYEYLLNYYNVNLTFVLGGQLEVTVEFNNIRYIICINEYKGKYKPLVFPIHPHNNLNEGYMFFQGNITQHNFYYLFTYFLQNKTKTKKYSQMYTFTHITTKIKKCINNYVITTNDQCGTTLNTFESSIKITDIERFTLSANIMIFMTNYILKTYKL